MGNLDGKIALITGAGQGIGQGIAHALAKEGASIVVSGRTESKLIKTVEQIEAYGGKALPVPCDVSSGDDIDALVARITELGVPAVFVESSMSPKLARTIAKEAGVTVVDAESLYADSLGAPGSGADTYLTATVHNTRVILEAWGAEAAPLPSTLQS